MTRGTQPSRAWVVGLVVVALAAAAAGDRWRREPAAASPPVARAAGDPAVPAADALSSTWYCAEGTAQPGGSRDQTILLANVGSTPAEAVVTVMPGPGQTPVSRTVAVAPFGDARVRIGDFVPVPEPGVVVEAFGGRVVVEHLLTNGVDLSVGPCARGPSPSWFFAAGTGVRGASELLALFNPFGDDAVVDVELLTDEGPSAPEPLQGLVVPRRSRITVPVHDPYANRRPHVAVHVRARVGRVVAERTLLLDGSDGRRGLATSLGATDLRREWTFPRPPQLEGARDTLVVYNPGDRPAALEIEVLVDGEAALAAQPRDVPPRSLLVESFDDLAPGLGYALVVRAVGTEAVVAETLTSWTARRGMATTTGSPAPSRRWFFTAGRLDASGDGVVSVVNPGTGPVTVTVRARAAGRPDPAAGAPEVVLAPGERYLVDLRPAGVQPGQLVEVEADGPVVAALTLAQPTGTSVAPGTPDGDASPAGTPR